MRRPLCLSASLSGYCLFARQDQTKPTTKTSTKWHKQREPSAQKPEKGHVSPLNYVAKGLLLALLVRVYDYSDYIHPTVLLCLYSFHIYFGLEIILAIAGGLAGALLGLELEPQFDEPYLSTSLQDFWGRRWNLMVTSILRPTVYEPIMSLGTRFMGRRWAQVVAILGTFAVSAAMHELCFYYLGRVRPTWEITWFFLIHGVCLVAEVSLKKLAARTCKWRLPRLVSTPLTVTVVMVTGFRLFFPQLLRCKADVRAFEEYATLGDFLNNVGRALTHRSFNAFSG